MILRYLACQLCQDQFIDAVFLDTGEATATSLPASQGQTGKPAKNNEIEASKSERLKSLKHRRKTKQKQPLYDDIMIH